MRGWGKKSRQESVDALPKWVVQHMHGPQNCFLSLLLEKANKSWGLFLKSYPLQGQSLEALASIKLVHPSSPRFYQSGSHHFPDLPKLESEKWHSPDLYVPRVLDAMRWRLSSFSLGHFFFSAGSQDCGDPYIYPLDAVGAAGTRLQAPVSSSCGDVAFQ